jgi:hypothetical protein
VAADFAPVPPAPTISVRTEQPDGILIRSYEIRSLKRHIARFAFSPMLLGLSAAAAVPAFNQVRGTSQEKAVTENLRKISDACAKYYAATGKNMATYDALVAGGYLPSLEPVAGENYHRLNIVAGTYFSIRLGDGRVVGYRQHPISPIPVPEDESLRRAPDGN